MHYRRFGRLGWNVSEIGYGMWGMAGWTGSAELESASALQKSVDMGCNFFDTAWAYGAGKSEKLLGQLLRNNPGLTLYTASKVPPKNFQWPSRRDFTLDDCFPPDHVESYVHRSLRNLGAECLDLIQLHTWEDAWIQDDRLVRCFESLKKKGAVKAVGISLNRWEPWNGIQAVRSGVIDAVQVIYNIFDQNPEDELFPACQKHDVAIIARVPFDEGTLTGTLVKTSTWPEGDWRNTYFVPENLHASLDRANALLPILPEGVSLPEMALRFILCNPLVSTTIPGMRKLPHVEANLHASAAGPLPDFLRNELRKHRWDRMPTAWSQ
jgi:aryl-alcohol dehydrogenase-like predicted oxidoreductase